MRGSGEVSSGETRSPFFPDFEDLPATIPIFPLSGVLLLPDGPLPLNIFEPRYLAMIDDALAGNRLIGMVQPRDSGQTPFGPRVYGTGCAGRITSLDETPDGRYLITLTGVCRFAVGPELPTVRGYRRVQADWSAFRCDIEGDPKRVEIDRERLLAALRPFFEARGISVDWQAISRTPEPRLVTSLAMVCPFDATEKQALLEAPDVEARARTLLALIEMAVLAQDGDKARH